MPIYIYDCDDKKKKNKSEWRMEQRQANTIIKV